MKWLVGISLVVNLVLAVVYLRMGKPSETLAGLGDSGAVDRIVTKTVFRTNVVEAVWDEPTAPPFDWSLVASDDVVAYMTNLRRLECPEWLVRHVIRLDLAAHYDARLRELQRVRRAAQWVTYREHRLAERAHFRAQLELLDECYTTMHQLTGAFHHEDIEDALFEDSGIALMFADMTYDQAGAVVSEVMYAMERREALDDLQQGYFTPADVAQMTRYYQTMRTRAGQSVSAVVMEEFWLRLQVVLASELSGSDPLIGMRLTGAQLRELMRIRSALIDPLERQFIDERQLDNRELAELNRQVADRLATTLGQTLADEYTRAQNNAFQTIYRFADSNELSEDTAIRIYDVREAAIDQVRNLMSDPTVDELLRTEMRQLIQLEVEKELYDTLGPEAYAAYRGDAGGWVDRVGGTAVPRNAPADTVPSNSGGGR